MKLLSASLIIALFLSSAIFAQSTTSKTNSNSASDQIHQQTLVNSFHDYFLAQPKVFVQINKSIEDKEDALEAQKIANAIRNKIPEIFEDPHSPVVGNLNSNIVVVEFFDYRCPHCKNMGPFVDDLIKNNPNVKFIFKAFPIFGDASMPPLKAGLASQKQGKFLKLHSTFLKTTQHLVDEEHTLEVAKQAGLNIEQLKKDMADPAIEEEIKTSHQLGAHLGIPTTPTFIFAKLKANPQSHTFSLATDPIIQLGETNQETLENAIKTLEKIKPSKAKN
jgi:protein-disulfide isomerase